MKDDVELLTDAISVTAELIKENTELKKENYNLRRSLRWCWNHAGIVFLKKIVDKRQVGREVNIKQKIDQNYNRARYFVKER